MALIETQIREAVSAAVEPVMRKQEAMSARLDAMSKARSGAGASGESLMFGGSPGVRIGESSLTSRGYSYARAAAVACGVLDPSHAKVEVELHHKLKSSYPGFQSQSSNSILTPIGSRLFQQADPSFADVRLLPVIPNPDKILCAGINYRSHAAETGRELPKQPSMFIRLANTLTGHEGELIRP